MNKAKVVLVFSFLMIIILGKRRWIKLLKKLLIMFKMSDGTQSFSLKPTALQKIYINSECIIKLLHTLREIDSISNTRHNYAALHQP